MIVITARSADDAWIQALDLLKKQGCVQSSRNGTTTELLHMAIEINNPRQRIVFAREINPAFAIAEVVWILSGANDLSFLSAWNSRMTKYADGANTYLHGAYGYRLGFVPSIGSSVSRSLRHWNWRDKQKPDQLHAALKILKNKPDSRQVILQYWDTAKDFPGATEKSKDIPCSVASHLLIRNDKLEWLHVMRSNDMIWGMPYNFVQFTTIQEIFAGWLGVEIGSYNHISDSLHIYDYHAEFLSNPTPQEDRELNHIDLRLPYAEWIKVWQFIVTATLHLGRALDAKQVRKALSGVPTMIPTGYKEWSCVLGAEAYRRLGYHDEALENIEGAGKYWGKSWIAWCKSKERQPERSE